MTAIVSIFLVLAMLVGIGIVLARLTPATGTIEPGDDTDSIPDNTVIEAVNAVLPQTQCAQCGYPGCRPYAEAIVLNNEPINRCPPGGETTIAQLAHMLGTQVLPLNDACGEQKPPQIALIDESQCIGCTLCILACPVDAIVGAAKQMHTVIANECTGCELCIPPCPVDCIELLPPPDKLSNWQWPKPA